MKIESRVSEITQKLQLSNDKSTPASRRISVASDPGGDTFRVSASLHRVKQQSDENQKNKSASINPIDIKNAVEKLNKLIRSQRRDVSFSVNEEAHATVIKIIKTETGELIKQFPPDQILAMIARLRKNIGWLVDEKA